VLEFIGGIVVLIFGIVILKMILARIFPDWGLKRATRRYMEDPSHANESLMWAARERVECRDARRDGI
jgi:hypothetical protein